MPKSSAKESTCSRNNYRQAADDQQAARGEVLGPFGRASALERSLESDACKAAPGLITTGGQALRGCPDGQDERSRRGHVTCSWCSGRKEGQLSLLLKSLASFCFSNLEFLFKFQRGMHCLSIALVVKFHSLSIIGFMTDLFSFSFSLFSLFLPGSGSCYTVDFKLYCKPCSAKYCLTLKELKRQDVMGIIPNCYSVGELSIRSSGPFHHPSESSL